MRATSSRTSRIPRRGPGWARRPCWRGDFMSGVWMLLSIASSRRATPSGCRSARTGPARRRTRSRGSRREGGDSGGRWARRAPVMARGFTWPPLMWPEAEPARSKSMVTRRAMRSVDGAAAVGTCTSWMLAAAPRSLAGEVAAGARVRGSVREPGRLLARGRRCPGGSGRGPARGRGVRSERW